MTASWFIGGSRSVSVRGGLVYGAFSLALGGASVCLASERDLSDTLVFYHKAVEKSRTIRLLLQICLDRGVATAVKDKVRSYEFGEHFSKSATQK